MARTVTCYTLKQLTELVGGELSGDPGMEILRPVPANSDDPQGITFAENEKFLKQALEGEIGAVIVPAETPHHAKPMIRVVNPRLAFGMVLGAFVKPLPSHGVDERAVISELATVDPSVQIGAYAIVEEGAVIGAGTVIHPHAYIGADCQVGCRCVIYPHAVLVQDVVMGDECIIHSGAILGSDGFGFYWDGTRQQKVPQVGRVRLGNQVEIGAHSCVDRATCGETVIGDGVKIDNLVQIGHNSSVGAHTVMASQVGISGSSVIGERNVFGGQAATSDHVTVGSDMVFGGRTGIIGNMDTPGEYFGTPAVPLSTAMRVLALQTRLPDLYKRMREMERQLAELKNDA